MPNERSLNPKVSVPFSCLPHVLAHQAKCIPDAPAVLAPERAPLTYGRLYQHVDNIGRKLRATGIGRRDRVAVVLPNGPEMAVAVLAVAANAACAPMNPAYRSDEWRLRVAFGSSSYPARSMGRPVCSRLRETGGMRRLTSQSALATWQCCCSRQALRRVR